MNDELFTTRLLSHLTGIEEYRVKSGNYSQKRRRFNHGLFEVDTIKLYSYL